MKAISHFFKRLWCIIILLFCYIHSRMPWRRKRVRILPFDAIFAQRIHQAANDGEIGIDFEKVCFEMSSHFYEENLCDGAFTPINDVKAHRFFSNLRNVINVRRGYLNGLYDRHYQPVTDNDRIVWGVSDSNGNVYIVGYESENDLVVKTNKE